LNSTAMQAANKIGVVVFSLLAQNFILFNKDNA
jgi:hypothetical protein